jgi:hypothetical protein
VPTIPFSSVYGDFVVNSLCSLSVPNALYSGFTPFCGWLPEVSLFSFPCHVLMLAAGYCPIRLPGGRIRRTIEGLRLAHFARHPWKKVSSGAFGGARQILILQAQGAPIALHEPFGFQRIPPFAFSKLLTGGVEWEHRM